MLKSVENMAGSVRIVLLLLVSFATTGLCSWWNIASNILQVAVKSVDERKTAPFGKNYLLSVNR